MWWNLSIATTPCRPIQFTPPTRLLKTLVGQLTLAMGFMTTIAIRWAITTCAKQKHFGKQALTAVFMKKQVLLSMWWNLSIATSPSRPIQLTPPTRLLKTLVGQLTLAMGFMTAVAIRWALTTCAKQKHFGTQALSAVFMKKQGQGTPQLQPSAQPWLQPQAQPRLQPPAQPRLQPQVLLSMWWNLSIATTPCRPIQLTPPTRLLKTLVGQLTLAMGFMTTIAIRWALTTCAKQKHFGKQALTAVFMKKQGQAKPQLQPAQPRLQPQGKLLTSKQLSDDEHGATWVN